MDCFSFHETLKAGQLTRLSELRRSIRNDFPDYMRNWFLATSKQANLSEREMRLVMLIVSSFSNSLLHYTNVPNTVEGNHAKQWRELPLKWRIIYSLIILLTAFLLSLIGAFINPFFAGILAILGFIVGVFFIRLWAKKLFGLGKASSVRNHFTNDAEASYNQMMILADTIDSMLEINRHEQVTQINTGALLTTSILLSIQKLIGSSKRGDEPSIIQEYIENIEDILPREGIRVLHYPEGGEDAFEIVSGKLHGVEVLPAMADNSGIIIPGKYMK